MKIKHILLAACIMAVNILPRTSFAQTARRTYSASNQLQDYSSNSSSVTARGPGQNPDVPVDGGISLLVAAGVALGAKKIHQHRSKNNAEPAE